jgi:CheY-like chemotaxis protein
MSFKHILIVEDDPKDIELMLNALEENHLANNITTVHDGVEALDYLYCRNAFEKRSPENPIVILLDLKMPRMDGLQVLAQIKADNNLRLIPVVILTSSGETQDIEACYRLGANAYVVKPVRFLDFVEAVKGVGVFWAIINEPLNNVK